MNCAVAKTIVFSDLRNFCDDVICPLTSSITCPWDSELVEGRVAPGKCCPPPSVCKCKPLVCDLKSACPSGTKKELVTRGTGIPGSCCDKYECRPQGKSFELDSNKHISFSHEKNINRKSYHILTTARF